MPIKHKNGQSSSEQEPDGRKRRSARSSQQIADALMRLIEGGNYMPRAHELAGASGLSLRTVFRHIEDMESLFKDLAEQSYSEIMPILMKPYGSADWKGQLDEAIDRRIIIYEKVMPFKLAADLRRFRSDALMANYRRSLDLEHAQLKGILPSGLQNDEVIFGSLQLAMSFQSWRRLRHDQDLSKTLAKDVVKKMAFSIVESQK